MSCTAANDYWFPIPRGRAISDLGSEESFRTALKWLRDCNTEHKCHNEASALPIRVVDVNSDPPRIYVTHGEPGTYLCLSHCWGKTVFPTLLTTNLDHWQTDLPIDTLSLTFKQAVETCRRLGYRYIWIDSLCIIQDSAEDWNSESGKMAAIYGGASLTIAATSASNGQEGLWVSITTNRSTVALDVTGPDGRMTKIYVRSEDYTHHQAIRNMYQAEPLTARAWVVQESFLSPRILHFSRCELSWTCDVSYRCECSPGRVIVKDGAGSSFARTYYRNIFLPSEYDATSSLFMWTEIVKVYSLRLLTIEKDVLPALSGIAQAMQKKTGDRYVAGLWASTLPLALLWSPANYNPKSWQVWIPRNRGPARRTSTYCAPTWSWASLYLHSDYKGKWIALESVFHDTAYIVNIDCELDGTNPTGRIKAASLTIRNLITKVYLTDFHFDYASKYNLCKVGYGKCDIDHVHTIDCVYWDVAGLAVLDTAHPGIRSTGISQFWSLLVCRKHPPHPYVFMDYTGISFSTDERSFIETCVISYHLLLEQKADHNLSLIHI